MMPPYFNIETLGHKMLDCAIQSQQQPDRVYRKHKCGAVIININISELDKQAVKEHKEIKSDE